MPFGIGNSETAGNLPPGSMGLPFLGEALAYARSPHRFIESRAAKYGPVFKTKILGSKVICFVGPGPFTYLADGAQFDRTGAAPAHVQELLCHKSLPLIDGLTHASMRGKVAQAFTPEAIASYLAISEKLVSRYVARWESLGEFAWADEYRWLVAGFCSAMMLGVESDFDQDRRLAETLDGFLAGLTAFPINLPFTTYGKSVRRRDDLLRLIDRAIADHGRSTHDDMLSRLLQARDNADEPLAPDELRAQMVHLFFAAYGGLYRAFALLCMNIAQHPEVRSKIEQELAVLPGGTDLDISTLIRLEYLGAVTRETRRHNRLFASNFFDNVAESSTFAGYDIPKGWQATGAIYRTMQDEAVFPDPARFEPDRFLAPRREHESQPNAYVPHGGGSVSGHRCPAEDLTTLLMQKLAATLIESYQWELIPDQDMLLTAGPSPMPKDGIRVRFSRLSS